MTTKLCERLYQLETIYGHNDRLIPESELIELRKLEVKHKPVDRNTKMEVLRLWEQGFTNKEIAAELEISRGMVNTYFRKLGLRNWKAFSLRVIKGDKTFYGNTINGVIKQTGLYPYGDSAECAKRLEKNGWELERGLWREIGVD